MNAKEFLKNFGHLADAPDGISKLRQTILQLAVQGKLVEQDPNDKSAGIMLQNFEANYSHELHASDNNSVSLPDGWACCLLGEIQQFTNGHAFPSQKFQSSGVGVIRIGDIQDNEIKKEGMKYISQEYVDSLDPKFLIAPGELVIAMSGATTGKLGFNKTTEHFALNQRVGRISPKEGIDIDYVFYLLTTKIKENLSISAGSAIPNLSTAQINAIKVPLPPLPEQKRIVAKVDELMALCDDLEAKQQERRAVHVRVNTAALDSLSTAETDTDFDSAWSRVRSNFDLLYSVPENVNALRQTILQLAVQGKLVEQDPSDEPASELMKRIREKKILLMKENSIPKPKETIPIQTDELPLIPASWQWVKFGDILLSIDSGWSPKCETRPRESDEWGVLKISAVTWGRFDPGENKALPKGVEPREHCEVKAGDFLMSRANTAELVAKSVVVKTTPKRLLMNDKLLRVSFPDEIFPTYINLVNNSKTSRFYYESVASGTSVSMRNVSRGNVCNLPITLPPLVEQQRIVAKVDELMALCNDLETKLAQQQGDAGRLTEAMVAAVLDGVAV
ncbi:restriction endonuclease subunit S [Pirellulales bacterium]|nr:restriction endonuclease subunit S [Pirellulales bacterium]